MLFKIFRKLVWWSTFPLPDTTRITIEKRLRGRDESSKLSRADCAVVSFGKSGRTWLRMMVSRFYQVRYGLPEKALLTFDNLHRRNAAIPKILFTHDNYLSYFTGNFDSKSDYHGSRLIFLARHPADVAVSQFFQWKYRMRPYKKKLNDYPPHLADVSIFDFVMHEGAGLPKIIEFMNRWAAEAPKMGDDMLIVSYEDLRSDTKGTLARILEFLKTPGENDEIDEAVEFSSLENMRKMETKGVFWRSGSRMVPKDKNNPQSYKVRRGKVGGYRDYFEEAEQAQIDALVAEKLSNVFGYGA